MEDLLGSHLPTAGGLTMAIDLGHCMLVVLNLARRDYGGAIGLGPELPVIDAAELVTPQGDGWIEATRGGARLLLWRANSFAGRGLFAAFGPRDVLDAFRLAEPLCGPASALVTAAIAGNANAQTVLRRWSVWRVSGFARRVALGALPSAGPSVVPITNEVVRLFPEGGQTPAFPLPTAGAPWRFSAAGAIVGTDGAAALRVNSVDGITLDVGIGGFDFPTIFVDEPDMAALRARARAGAP
jgi:hypothetical protein